MKLPSKITSYKESVLSNFAPILDILAKEDSTVLALYGATKRHFIGIEEFMDTLDCLYALEKIVLDEENEVIHYAARNIL